MAWEDSENKTKIYIEGKISEWTKCVELSTSKLEFITLFVPPIKWAPPKIFS